MSDKKRKRRSFWEPESEKLVEWLDAQTDLGTSLQLIIVDAIHKYGEGDVIKAHLNQRENFYYDTETQTPVRKLAPMKAVSRPEPTEPNKEEDITTPLAKSAPGQTDEVSPPHVSELETDSELELEAEALEETESARDSDDTPTLDISDIMSDEDENIEEVPAYDPLSIMMEDIGSTIKK